jgi:GcrA cell cycle regulator
MTKAPHVKPTFIIDRVQAMKHLSNEEIAGRLNCSTKYVQDCRHRTPEPALRGGSRWTAERDTQLRLLQAAGLSCSIIAARMGTTRNAVIGRIHRLGIPGRQPTTRRTYPKARKPAGKPIQSKPLSPAAQVIKAIKRDGLPVPPLAETDVPRVAFIDLENHHCRFIALPEPVGPFVPQFCGLPKAKGLAYCEAHVVRCYSGPNPARPVKVGPRELEVA